MSTDEPDDPTHVQADDAEAILERAVELAAAETAEQEARVAVAELERAAAEVGVPPSAVAAAVAEHTARRRLRWGIAGAVALVSICAGLTVGAALLATALRPETPAPTPRPEAPGPPPPAAAPEATPTPPEPVAPEPPATLPSEPPPRAPEADGTEPVVTPAPSGTLVPVPLSGGEAGRAQAALVGTWQLVGWVAASGEPLEVAASARPATEASAEVWHFLAGGRFRRTLGEDFASSGRWTLLGTTEEPAALAWLGIETWWLVALDQVRITALPGQVRPRAWALVGRDGPERVIYFLGEQPELSPKTLGARTVPAEGEGARP